MAIQDYCIGLKGAVNAIHRVTRALSGNVNSTTISDAVEEVAIAIENGGGGGGGGSNLFIAVRGVTSYADVAQAINDGKVVLVDIYNDGTILFPMRQGLSAQRASFRGIAYVGAGEAWGAVSVNSDDTWTAFDYSSGDLYATFQWTYDILSDYTKKTYVDTANNNLQAQIDALEAPVQTQGNWMYKVYSDGTFDAWYKATGQSLTITATSGNLYRSELQTLILPTDLTDEKTVTIQTATPGASHNNYPVWAILANVQNTEVRYYALSGGSRTASPNYIVTAHVFGTIQ